MRRCERGKGEGGQTVLIFDKIMTENIPKVNKEADIQILESKRVPKQ